MPGTFVVRPVEATLTGALSMSSYSRSIDPYCEVKIGHNTTRSHPAKDFGTHPHWDEELVIQQGDENVGKVILRDTNHLNPNRNIGEVKLDLNDVTSKGRVVKWFDINKDKRKQGEILMEVTYTNANPQTRAFHDTMKEGAGIPPSREDEVKHQIDHHHITEKDRREFHEATKDPKFRYGCGRDHDKEPHHKKTLKEFIDERENIDLANRQKIAKKDPTLPDGKVSLNSRTGHTGISNPNTMKLGINEKQHGQYTPSYQLAEEEAHPRVHHSKHIIDMPEGPQKGPWEQRDPTVNRTTVKPYTSNSGMSNPNTMKLGVNHDLAGDHIRARERPLMDQPHPKRQQNARGAAPQEQRKAPFWEADPTVKHHAGRPYPNQQSREHHGGQLVDVPENPAKDAWEHRDPSADHRPHITPHPHSKYHDHDEHPGELRHGHWEEHDPTINHTRVHPGHADSGMSNPNTMKLGVNHDLPEEHYNYDREAHDYYAHAGVPKGSVNDTRFHHIKGAVDMSKGAEKGTWNETDPTINHVSFHPGTSNSGMSNPNTMKMGANLHDAPRYMPAKHGQFLENEVVYNDPRVHHGRHLSEVEQQAPTRGPWEARDPTVRDTRVHPGAADSGMSNPNTMKLGVNKNQYADYYDEGPLIADAQPRGRYSRTVVEDTSEAPIKGPAEQRNQTITHNRPSEQRNQAMSQNRGRTYANTNTQSNAHHGGVVVDVPENPAKEAYEHRDPSADHRPHISEHHSKYHRDCSKESRNLGTPGVAHQVQSGENQRFEPVVDTITDAAPRGRYSRQNFDDQVPNAPVRGPWQKRDPTVNQTVVKPYSADTGMSNPNTMKLGVNHEPVYQDPYGKYSSQDYVAQPQKQPPAVDRYGQPFHHHGGVVDHGTYIPEHGPEDMSDTGMSNPNMIGMDYQMLKGMRNAEQQLLSQKRVQGFQECSHPVAFGIDKITKTNDTSLGCYEHPEHLWENGMSDPNNARFGYNHHVERPSTRNSGGGYTTAQHTHPNEVDKITRINDSTLGRQKDIQHVWDEGMSNPNSMQKGWNHADAKRKGSFNLQHHDNHLRTKNLGADKIDKITTVHDTALSHRKHFY